MKGGALGLREGGGEKKKALKQILSQQRAQMRHLTKGNNYLFPIEANLNLKKNKKDFSVSVRKCNYLNGIEMQM